MIELVDLFGVSYILGTEQFLEVVVIHLQFSIQDKEILYLINRDPQLGWLIHEIGDISVPMSNNNFELLVHSIIGQQLSFQAAKTISNRVQEFCKELTPEIILESNEEGLRACGLSKAKITYLKDLSAKVLHEVQFSELQNMADEQVIKVLTKVKGIGPWTAEMFLIFALGRLDVFSSGDASLKKAMKWLYQLDMHANMNDLSTITEKWMPYRTVASLYLWDAIDSGFIK